MIDLGTVQPGSTIRIPFSTFNTAGAAVTMTNFAAADILIYKDGSTTERASTSGYTATTDFDGKTGKHLAVIDLADNTTADFFAAGSEYIVALDSVTVDSQTVGAFIGRFRIGYSDAVHNTTLATLSSQTSFTLTAGPADDNALVGCIALIHDAASAVQRAIGVVSAYTGSTKTVTLAADPGIFTMAAKDNISFFVPANTRFVGGTVQTARDIGASVLLSSGTGTGQLDFTSGVVKSNVTQFGGTNGTFSSGRPSVDVNSLAANSITAAAAAADFGAEIQALITGGAYALATDANGRIRIVDGTGTGELDTTSGKVDVNDKTGFRLSATGVDDIWDEAYSGHQTAGTLGLLLNYNVYWDTVYDGLTGTVKANELYINGALSAGAIRSALGLSSANLDTQFSGIPAAVWANGTRTLSALGFTLGASDLATGIITAAKFAADAIDSNAIATTGAQEIRNAITGGAYALDTDANGRIRIVDGTAAGELDTSSGLVSVVASSVRSALGMSSANLDTQLDALPTALENAAALLDYTDGVESGITPRKSWRAMSAILAGIISGAGSGTEVFKGIGQSSGGTTRVTVNADGDGNRTALILNL